MAEAAGVLDSIVAGALATTDADGSEGSDAGDAGIGTAAELAGTTTVEDVSEVCFEHAASTSSEAAAAKVQLPFMSTPSNEGVRLNRSPFGGRHEAR
jgi:hypothetical protein